MCSLGNYLLLTIIINQVTIIVGEYFYCNSSNPCSNITCSDSNDGCEIHCEDGFSCSNAHIDCGFSPNCTILCNGKESCEFAFIDATNVENSLLVSFISQELYHISAKNATIYCPYNKYILNKTNTINESSLSRNCKIECTELLSCDYLSIYAINGLNDLKFIFPEEAWYGIAKSKIYCGNSYQFRCKYGLFI